MTQPSFTQRHALLAELLDTLDDRVLLSDSNTLNVGWKWQGSEIRDERDENRDFKLDELLLQGWSRAFKTQTGTAKEEGKPVRYQVVRSLGSTAIQRATELRLNHSDFDVLGRVGEGQFGMVCLAKHLVRGI